MCESPCLTESKEDRTCHVKRGKSKADRLKKGRMKEAVSTLSAVFRTTRSVLKTAFRLRLEELLCSGTQQTQQLQPPVSDFLRTTSTSGLLASG